MKIKDVIEEGVYKNPAPKIRWFKANCTPTKFKELFIESASNKMFGSDYKVDSDNKQIINQLYFYLIGSDQFVGDLNKGILLSGAIGNGKTIIMESFIDVFHIAIDERKRICKIHAKEVGAILSEPEKYNAQHFKSKPLFIDDIGKEESEIKVYGTNVAPFEDLISDRYKHFAITFGTTNYKFEDMKYSRHTIDRMRQMFNVIVLPGKSRR